MKTVFADTGYWIALVNPRDSLSVKAKTLTQKLIPFKIVTSEKEILEALAYDRHFEQAGFIALLRQN